MQLYKVMNETNYPEEHTTQLNHTEAAELIAELEEMCRHYHNTLNRVHTYLEEFNEHSMEFDYMEFQDYIGGEEE